MESTTNQPNRVGHAAEPAEPLDFNDLIFYLHDRCMVAADDGLLAAVPMNAIPKPPLTADADKYWQWLLAEDNARQASLE